MLRLLHPYCQNRLGQDKATDIFVGLNACNGTYACDSVGQEQATSVTINQDACQGIEACDSVGSENSPSVEIAMDACNTNCECNECLKTSFAEISLSPLTGRDCVIDAGPTC